jgi:hypothetical protein
MVELLPCPFCGVKMIQLYDEKQREVGWEHPPTYDCILGCVGRDCEGLYVAPNDEELWNTRTPKERGGEK